MENEYKAEFISATKELSKIEQYRVCDCTNAISIQSATDDGPLIVEPNFVAFVKVHNPKNKLGRIDSTRVVVADKAGTLYFSASESLNNAVNAILDILKDEPGWAFEFSQQESTNRAGQNFITAGVVEI